MKIVKLTFAIIVLSGLGLLSTAQNNETPYGEWGKAGIFLKLSEDLSQVKAGSFEIYDGNSTKPIGKVFPPKDKREFENRLRYFHRFLPHFQIPSQNLISRLWTSFNKNKSIDSLYFWGTAPVVQLSLGMMYLDTAAVRGKENSYLVKYLDANGKITKEAKSNIVEYKEFAETGKIIFKRKTISEPTITLYFISEPPYPSTVKIFRRPRVNMLYHEINATVGFLTNDEELNILCVNGAVDSGSVYQYFVTPLDKFEKEGINSDTVFCGTYDFSKVFLPNSFRAENVDSLRGIKISWYSVYYPFVKRIVLERSEIFDSLFTKIAELPSYQTVFIDRNVEPMKKYFYRMKLIGSLNEETPYSVRVFAMYEDKTAPLPPFGLKGKGLENGVELSWISVEPFIKGFYVYRSNGVNDELKLISDLIPAMDSLTIFKDTSSALHGAYTYAYSIVAENSSHVQSQFSDPVFVRPLIKEKLIPPTNVKAIVEENGVQLYWDDMRKVNKTVIGYTIYKREISSPEKTEGPALIDTMLFPENNNFFDAKIEEGKSYEYFIRTHGLNESVSELSAAAVAEPKMLELPAPAKTTASAKKNGILIKWDKPGDKRIDKFVIYRYRRGEKEEKLAEISTSEKNEYFDSSAEKGNLYFYFIVSVDKQNNRSRAGRKVGAIIE